VSIHERRAKFKPTLFLFTPQRDHEPADLQERWFAGNHGDVGGGWPTATDAYALSEIPLKWMIDEVRSIQPTLPVGVCLQLLLYSVAHTLIFRTNI
jgi:hypothetical protein